MTLAVIFAAPTDSTGFVSTWLYSGVYLCMNSFRAVSLDPSQRSQGYVRLNRLVGELSENH